MDIQAQLLADIEAFMSSQKMTAAEFGRRAVHDHKLVSRLRAQKDMKITTVDRVREFIRSHPDNPQ